MRLGEIKAKVWSHWLEVQVSRRTVFRAMILELPFAGLASQPGLYQAFQAEIRQFGDLRYRQTWLDAFVRLDANGWMKEWHADPIGFVGYYANPDGVGALVKEQLRAEMESYPDFLDAAKRGLEMLFGEEVLSSRDEEIKSQLLTIVNEKSLPLVKAA